MPASKLYPKLYARKAACGACMHTSLPQCLALPGAWNSFKQIAGAHPEHCLPAQARSFKARRLFASMPTWRLERQHSFATMPAHGLNTAQHTNHNVAPTLPCACQHKHVFRKQCDFQSIPAHIP
eukprot:1156044-Pelagomonas_calceolata.AAC.9